jgi:hypothetical protein
MTKPASLPTDETSLRRRLHENIDKMNGVQLALTERVLLQLELDELSRELDEAFDAEIRAGRITPERIQQAIDEHRAKHPYR